MKKLSIIAFLMLCFSVVLITSCKDEENDDKPVTEALIVGTWKCTSGKLVVNDIETSVQTQNVMVTLKSDHTFTAYATGNTFGTSGTWSLSNNQLTMTGTNDVGTARASSIKTTVYDYGKKMHWEGTVTEGVAKGGSFDFYFEKQ